MIDKNKIQNFILNNFSRWMDIRRRTSKSAGGKFIYSVSDEINKIQIEIDKYKKSFFIDNYEGKEDDIPWYSYRSQIGNPSSIIIQEFKINQVNNTKDFFKNENNYYIEDGYIYFNNKFIENNLKQIDDKYSINVLINNFKTSLVLEKYFIWNIFDEFAAFVGLKRHYDESNKELEYRILHRKQTNSTIEGLKNVIINELQNENTKILEDEIKIEIPTPENLQLYYDKFTKILDHLMYINKDVYKTKKWNIDSWNNFTKIDYIPHVWDIVIDNFQNGIGYKDDLAINTNRNIGIKTDVNLKLYTKDTDSINKYVKKHNINKKIKINLEQYDNYRTPIDINYKINASDAYDITDKEISICCYKDSIKQEINNIQDFIIPEKKNNIKLVQNNLLNDNNSYKLIFRPTTSYQLLDIEKCSVKYSNSDKSETINLLEPKNNFILNEDKHLTYKYCKTLLKKDTDFNYYSNTYNSNNRINILNNNSKAVLSYNVSNFKNNFLYLKYDCEPISIPLNSMNIENLIISNGRIISEKNNIFSKKIEFDIKANEVSFNIYQGECIIHYSIDNGKMIRYNDELSSKGNIKIKANKEYTKSDIAKNIHIEILNTTELIAIKDFEYKAFNLNLILSKGKILEFKNGLAFPDEISNNLTIEFENINKSVPYIEYLYVGPNVSNVKYETREIKYKKDYIRTIDFKTNCIVDLYEFKNNKWQLLKENYNCISEYEGLSSNAYLKLDLSKLEYNKIHVYDTNDIMIDIQIDNSTKEITIPLSFNQKIKYFITESNSYKRINKFDIKDILEVKEKDKIIISYLSDKFIIKNKEGIFKKSIKKDFFKSKADKYAIEGDIEEISGVFASNNKKFVCNNFSDTFDTLYFIPKNHIEYTCYNKYTIFKPYTNGIKIINQFSPLLDDINKNLYYEILPMNNNDKFNIRFETNKDFNLMKNWTIGNTLISIKSEDALINSNMYTKKNTDFEINFDLQHLIPIKQYVQNLDLRKYIISVDNASIVYSNRNIEKTYEEEPEFYSYETLNTKMNNFNKLKYSNIDEILYIGFTPYEESLRNELNENEYNLLKDEGIIVFNKIYNKDIYIYYTVKIPTYIKLNIDELYKTISYDINAYKQIGTYTFRNMDEGIICTNYDIYKDDKYKSTPTDKVIVSTTNPWFDNYINDKSIILKRNTDKNLIAIKKGYYYINNKEYYLFNNDDIVEEINTSNNVDLNRVDIQDGEMYLHKKSNNYMLNSKMLLGEKQKTYKINFEDTKIPLTNSNDNITACDSFNYWKTFDCNLYFTKGINDIAIALKQNNKNGYAYIDITEKLTRDINEISLYCSNNIKISIGYRDMNMPSLINIDNSNRLFELIPNSKIYKLVLDKTNQDLKDKNYRYYLIIQGDGIIDDIIISDSKKDKAILELHTKEIDKLKIFINEKIDNEYKFIDYFNAFEDHNMPSTEIDSFGKIVNKPNINWGWTDVKKFNNKKDFKELRLKNILLKNNSLYTLNDKKGYIESKYIYIGNSQNINELFLKINNINIEEMSNFKITLIASDFNMSNEIPLKTFYGNIIDIKNFNSFPYIKFKIEMPIDKIIDSISLFVNYKTDSSNELYVNQSSFGEFYSKIIDTMYMSNYKLSRFDIKNISSLNDIDIYIRASRDYEEKEIWTEWKKIQFTYDFSIENNIVFNNYRFFQYKIVLKKSKSYITPASLELEGC